MPERLIDAATALFAERGFEATSVQDVVTAAGVTKGAMYHYFTSKDDLLYEIYHRLLTLQAAHLEEFLAANGPADERLHAAAVDVVETSADHFDAFVVYLRSAHLLDVERQRVVRTERRRYHDRFRLLVEQGQTAQVFRRDVSPDLAVHAFFGAAHAIPTWFHADGPLSLADIAGQLADLLLAALRA